MLLTPLQNQRGQAMVAMGIGMLAFVGLTALAVDVAQLAFTATEVQSAADAAATAAAARLSQGTGGETEAINNGWYVAHLNTAAGEPVEGACPPTCIELGKWDANAMTFTASGSPPYNAARATVTKTGVHNLIPLLSESTSTVTKVAVAALRPTLPFAIGIGSHCDPPDPANPGDRSTWNPRFENPTVDCATNPVVPLKLANGTPGGPLRSAFVGWANFNDNGDGATTGVLLPMMPATCGGGEGAAMPVVQADLGMFRLNQNYSAGGGLEASLYQCWNDQIKDTFVIPFFSCDDSQIVNATAATVGFGVVKIVGFTGFDPGNPGSDTGVPTITLQLRCSGPTQVSLVQ